jgi:hypothetical protein
VCPFVRRGEGGAHLFWGALVGVLCFVLVKKSPPEVLSHLARLEWWYLRGESRKPLNQRILEPDEVRHQARPPRSQAPETTILLAIFHCLEPSLPPSPNTCMCRRS